MKSKLLGTLFIISTIAITTQVSAKLAFGKGNTQEKACTNAKDYAKERSRGPAILDGKGCSCSGMSGVWTCSVDYTDDEEKQLTPRKESNNSSGGSISK